MRLGLTLVASVSLLLSHVPAFADEPVFIGLEEGYDACGAISETIGMTNVHTEPNRQSGVKDSLAGGILVWDCDWREINGVEWSGVVYSLDKDADCGPMGTPIPEAREYVGPCSYGWIHREDLTFIAG
jgi:hypothetical protein